MTIPYMRPKRRYERVVDSWTDMPHMLRILRIEHLGGDERLSKPYGSVYDDNRQLVDTCEWIEDNLKGVWCCYSTGSTNTFMFENTEDAALFRMFYNL